MSILFFGGLFYLRVTLGVIKYDLSASRAQSPHRTETTAVQLVQETVSACSNPIQTLAPLGFSCIEPQRMLPSSYSVRSEECSVRDSNHAKTVRSLRSRLRLLYFEFLPCASFFVTAFLRRVLRQGFEPWSLP